MYNFFFQAEDGIRDGHVTGVQTCALPIYAKGRAGVEWLLGLFMLLLMGLLCFYAWEWILRPDVQLEKSGTTGLPKWYTYAAFPIALSFLCWHQLTRLLNQCFPQPGREAL